jgi:hypothetical protein
MNRVQKTFNSLAIAAFLVGILATSADAKSSHKYSTKPNTLTRQSIDNDWDSDLDSNWGYDYSLNPNEFGQNLNGPNGDFGYGGFGYGYGGW